MNALYAWLAAVAAALAALFGAHRSGRARERDRQDARRKAEEAARLSARIDTLNTAQDIRHETDARPADDVTRRLRDRWTRADD